MNAATKEKIFDLILTDALKESMKIEFEEIDKLTAEETHEFSPQFEKKMRKLINSIGRKDRIKKFKRFAVKSVVVLSIVFTLIFGGLLTQPEVFAAVQNVFRSIFDKYDKYEYLGEELTSENFDNDIKFGYVPDGYSLSKGDYSPIDVTLFYTNETDKIIFEYCIANFTTSLYDNEHSSYSSFILNDVEYHYYESNDNVFTNKLIWYKDGYEFGIYAHLSKEELVKIAENLKK